MSLIGPRAGICPWCPICLLWDWQHHYTFPGATVLSGFMADSVELRQKHALGAMMRAEAGTQQVRKIQRI